MFNIQAYCISKYTVHKDPGTLSKVESDFVHYKKTRITNFRLVEKRILERMDSGAADDTDSFIHDVMKVI